MKKDKLHEALLKSGIRVVKGQIAKAEVVKAIRVIASVWDIKEYGKPSKTEEYKNNKIMVYSDLDKYSGYQIFGPQGWSDKTQIHVGWFDSIEEALNDAKKHIDDGISYQEGDKAKIGDEPYTDEEYEKLYQALNALPLRTLRNWAELAWGPEGRNMPKNEIIKYYMEANGDQAIDEMRDGRDIADLFDNN